MATRATTGKRRTLPRDMFETRRLRDHSPPSPLPLPQPASAPTSRLRKRQSTGWSSMSPETMRGSSKPVISTPEKVLAPMSQERPDSQATSHEPTRLAEPKLITLQNNTPEDSPTFHRTTKSTISSLRTRSPSRNSFPGSASVSQSNTSTAPILPILGNFNPQSQSRNKLVKRSSSQRALNGSNNLHSTLRRPATSHQRSATIQRHYIDGEEISNPTSHSSPLPKVLSEQHQTFEDTSQKWRPFFKTRYSRVGKSERSRKGTFRDLRMKEEDATTIVPDLSELPTLLLSTSISARTSEEATTGRSSNLSRLTRPFTPFEFRTTELSESTSKNLGHQQVVEERPRSSFSLSGVLSTPSTSKWRISSAGSLRGKRLLGKYSGERRIVSAPQNTRGNPFSALPQHDQALGNHTLIYASRNADETPSRIQHPADNTHSRSPSSPLPPLNRLSSFQVDLPDTIPLYPPSPSRDSSPTSLPRAPASSSPTTSPFGGSSPLYQPLSASAGQSENAFTLLGSDHENSRILSGDEDDTDGRSSTVYDSTRTGATGSSVSGTKRPHIETIFDESPPLDLPYDRKMLALKDLHIADTAATHHSHFEPRKPLKPLGPRSEIDTTVSEKERAASHTNNSDKQNSVSRPSSHTGRDIEGLSNSVPTEVEADAAALPSTNVTTQPLEISEVLAHSALGSAKPGPRDEESRSRRSTPRRRDSPSSSMSRPNPFEWSEQSPTDRDGPQAEGARPKTVHGRQGKDSRSNRSNGRRGPTPLHLRSQSVPVPNESRGHANPSKFDSWILGNKGPSEDWDGDFDFEEPTRAPKPISEGMRPSLSSGMLVPSAILERQASVHGQFGQVKELSKLVEELKRLQQLARLQGIIKGQAAEIWKEAEGIINLATLDDDEQEFFPPQSPIADFDFFDEESPSNRRRRSGNDGSKDDESNEYRFDQEPSPYHSPRGSNDLPDPETPQPSSRARKESSAKAKSVLENIHQQRSHYGPALLDAKVTQKKLPFDTTSLKDLVTRAGVVTRALKEEVRRAEARNESAVELAKDGHRPDTPPDPPWTKMLQKPSPSPSFSKSPRVTQSPKSPKSSTSSMLGGSIAGNDNDINGHMKIMTAV